jgi:hypothetical protein
MSRAAVPPTSIAVVTISANSANEPANCHGWGRFRGTKIVAFAVRILFKRQKSRGCLIVLRQHFGAPMKPSAAVKACQVSEYRLCVTSLCRVPILMLLHSTSPFVYELLDGAHIQKPISISML